MGERGDRGFEVVPTRIGGSGGPGRSLRRPRGPIILVLLLAIAIPTVAWIGPRIVWRPEVDISFLRPTPPAPTSTPRPTPVPTRALPTPLPGITVGVGPHPTEPFPVDVDGLRLADPTTGSLGPPLGLRGDTDAIFTSPNGKGWWCVCFDRVSVVDRETATVEIRRIDRSGRVTLRQTVGEYRSVAPPPSQDFYTRFDLVVSPDERTAYLTSATRSGDRWAVAVEAIDLANGRILGRTDLGIIAIPPIPGPTPPPEEGTFENYLSGPFTRLSPDGRRMLVWAWMDGGSPSGPQAPPVPQGWLIDVGQEADDGGVGLLTTIGESLATRLRGCWWVAWTTGDELGAVCWPIDGFGSTPTLTLVDPQGTELGHVDLASTGDSWIAEPLLDRANRLVFSWQPTGHTLQRVDLDRLKVDALNVDPAATVGRTPGSGSGGPGGGLRPEWASFTSSARIFYVPQLLAEPGGDRLFALGIRQEEGGRRYSLASTGIWVFGAGELSLLDRWAPVAAYGSIGLSSDQRWLMAAGQPRSDEDGNETNWESSITVHDVADGRPALQLGMLGPDAQVLQVPP
jgi:hypothetical protein